MKKAILSLILFIPYSVNTIAQQVTVFPHEEDFEGTPTCSTFCGAACSLNTSWKNTGGDDIDWTADNGGTSSFNTGPSQDHNPGTSSGIYLYTEASGCSNDNAYLLSPRYDFTFLQSAALEFWYHMQGSSMGSLHVDARVGTGNWTNDISPQKSGDQGNSWKKWTIDLPQYEGLMDVQFRIRGRTGSSFTSDMAVDDIFVGAIFDHDLAIWDVLSPVQDCNFSGTHDVTLRIRNLGLQNQSSFSLAYQINDRAPVIEAYSGTINSDQTKNFTFSQQATFNGDSNFVFKSWIIFPMDENKINDSVLIGLKTIMPWGPETFEGFDGRGVGRVLPGWNEGLGNNPNIAISDWRESDSLQSVFYGGSTARINIKGTGINDWLLTPSFKVTQPSRLYYSAAITDPNSTTNGTMGSDDQIKVRVSNDCGNTWSDQSTFNASSGLNNQLAQNFVVLDSWVGSEVIIGFQALSGSNDPEDYDFHIGFPEAQFVYPNDVGVSGWRLASGGTVMNAGTGDYVRLTIKNFGSNSVNTIPVLAEVGNSLYQYIHNPNLGPNNEQEVQVGGYWAYSNGPAQVPVKMYTLLSGDTINFNDTLFSFITVLGVTGLDNGLGSDEISIYPNPNNGNFQVEFGAKAGFNQFVLMDRTGKEIFNQELVSDVNGMFINLNSIGIGPGVYFLVLDGDTRSKVTRLVVE